MISGLGTVLGFMPEILVLFFFIFMLEESGYLPRAAFILDRPMRAVGLTGRSFIPLAFKLCLRDSRHHRRPQYQ